MANIKFKNFATTTLVGTYGTGDTALTVSNASLFPVVSGGTTWFYAVLTDSLTAPTKREIVKVTNISGSILTVTRAQDNTTAQTWANGSYIELRVVAKALEDLISETATDARTSTTDYTTTADSDANGSGSHIRKIGSTTYETLSSTVDTFEVPVSQPREISVAEYGAVGDYVPSTGVGTNDTTAIQNALNAAYTAGGGVVTLENKIYKLGSAITIPVGVVLRGPNAAPTGGYVGNPAGAWVAGGVDPEVGGSGWSANGRKFRSMTGSLWVCFDAGIGDGTGTYAVQNVVGLTNYNTRTGAIIVKGELDGVNVFQYSFNNNNDATYTDTGTWNSAWNSGYMSGLGISLSADDATVRNCFIGGFNEAILGYGVSRPHIDNVHMDCLNGIELSSVYDRAYINKVHSYLFSSFSESNSSLVRRGTFMYIHDTVDWAEITNCFTYGHKYGYYLQNINECSLTNCAADNTSAEVATFIGLVIETGCQDVAVVDFRAANREYGIYVDNDAGNQSVLVGCNLLDVDRGYHVLTGNVTIIGGKVRGSGANKLGVSNLTTGNSVVVENVTFDTITTEYTGEVMGIKMGQIRFPATDVPSTDANTLDDYQEVDFTPALAGSTTAGTQTYSLQAGKATKIGRQVIATFNITLTAKDGATAGDIRVTGLPFTSGSTITYGVVFSRTENFDLDVAGGYYRVEGRLAPSTTYITLYEAGDNIGPVVLTAADFNATTSVWGTVIYNV